MAHTFENIRAAGGDTGKRLALARRLAIIQRHLRPGGGRFLECGCGSGAYVLALQTLPGLEVHGIEIDEEKLKAAHANPAVSASVSRGDLEALAFPDQSWDYALLNEVLEHVPDDRLALREVHRVLRPGGLLFIFSPNRWFPFETHGTFRKKDNRYLPHWLPFIPWIPLSVGQRFLRYWARNYWQGELAGLVEEAGFTIVHRTFVGITFENITGRQPALVRVLRPLLRFLSSLFERTPFLRRFSLSQVLVCRR